MNALHIITTLNSGGAEAMLVKLLTHSDRNEYTPRVLSLTGPGVYGKNIEEMGIPVYSLGLRPRSVLQDAATILAMVREVERNGEPDIIFGWMPHGMLAALIAKNFAWRKSKLVWNVRHSILTTGKARISTIWLEKALARLSHLADKIVYNSTCGARCHEELGFSPSKSVIFHNGFNLDLYAPSLLARKSVRQELGLAPESLIIGLVARYDPLKDHKTFLKAAKLLLETHPDVHFLLVGRDVIPGNIDLYKLVLNLGLSERVHLLGERMDIPRLTAAFDIASCSSISEGFPNSIGEAMSCSVPCVVTDVGDAKDILGGTGVVVPSQDPISMSNAFARLIDFGMSYRQALGADARIRMETHFSIKHVAELHVKYCQDWCHND